DFERLADTVENQKRFASVVRDLIAALDMGDELGSEEGEGGDDDDADEQPDDAESGSEESEGSEGKSEAEVEAASEEGEAGESEGQESEASDDIDDTDEVEAKQPGEAKRPNPPTGKLPPQFRYKAFTTRFDEEVKAEVLCDVAELDRLRAALDKQ